MVLLVSHAVMRAVLISIGNVSVKDDVRQPKGLNLVLGDDRIDRNDATALPVLVVVLS
jgi:hypothetical protein